MEEGLFAVGERFVAMEEGFVAMEEGLVAHSEPSPQEATGFLFTPPSSEPQFLFAQ